MQTVVPCRLRGNRAIRFCSGDDSGLSNGPAARMGRYFALDSETATLPSFTGSVAPGLNDVFTTPSLPSSR